MTVPRPRRAVPLALAAALVSCEPPVTRWTVEFEYFRVGGTCETGDGPATCTLRVAVHDDGTWTASGVPRPAETEGTLPMGAASELAIVFDQSWRYFTEVPFTGVCPARTGGQEYGYVVRRVPYGEGSEEIEPQEREVRSCVYDLERYDSLVKRNQIETAWLAFKPPELDHVEFR